MSEENVEVVRKLTDAANRLDLDAFVDLLSPDVVWEENRELPGVREVYLGREEVREWFNQVVIEPWENLHAEIEEITELGDHRVFAETVITVRGKGSGVPVDLDFWSLVSFADGKIARRQVFWSREEALEAAGLQE
jgi:ketosteroid isomerase-like protein